MTNIIKKMVLKRKMDKMLDKSIELIKKGKREEADKITLECEKIYEEINRL